MKKYQRKLAIAMGTIAIATASGCAHTGSDPIKFSEPLDTITMKTGKEMHLNVGIGSGACRLASDPENIIYTITDRGPNIKTKDAEKLVRGDFSNKKGKIFPIPNFTPTIYKILVQDGRASVLGKIQIKTASGMPVSGISNARTEPAWDINAKALEYDPSGLDSEGIVKMADGSFWICDEYGPSILHVTAHGRVIERWVPKGVKKTLEGSGYEVKELLPAILRHRPLNRGIESITASPDQQYLYFAMQSPLANPNKKTYKQSRNLRLFKVDLNVLKVIGEYVYPIDFPETFVADNAKKQRQQSDVKVSEMTAVGVDQLVVLERISKTTKFYRVDLDSAENILGSAWDSVKRSPSLEQTDTNKITVLKKKLLMNSDDRGGMMKKIEGLAWMGEDKWIMVNDNDFGIDGDSTFIVPVEMQVE